MDKHNLRIGAFDLDGTVLDGGRMSPAVREALLALRDSGVAVVAASGRDVAQIKPEIMECFSHALAANGAYIINNGSGEFLSREPMDPALAATAVKTILKHRGGPTAFLCGKMASTLRSPLFMPGGSVASYCKTKDNYCPELILSPCLAKLVKKRPVYKIQGFFKSLSHCSAAVSELTEIGGLEVLDMGDCSLELTMAGITKAAGLKKLCGALGMSLDELAAFGDSRNDLDMLSAAGCAVAMANGSDCVKKIADFVAEDVSQDGVAKAIYQLFPICGTRESTSSQK